MVKINLYIIEKKENDEYNKICEHFIKSFKKYGSLKIYSIWNKDINKAHKSSNPKQIYTTIFERYLKNQFNIALDVNGKTVNSYIFSDILKNKQKINFFIAGAYGFENDFLNNYDLVLSLSDLTLSHKIAKVVLCEQIFRGFSIIYNHPYHKN